MSLSQRRVRAAVCVTAYECAWLSLWWLTVSLRASGFEWSCLSTWPVLWHTRCGDGSLVDLLSSVFCVRAAGFVGLLCTSLLYIDASMRSRRVLPSLTRTLWAIATTVIALAVFCCTSVTLMSLRPSGMHSLPSVVTSTYDTVVRRHRLPVSSPYGLFRRMTGTRQWSGCWFACSCRHVSVVAYCRWSSYVRGRCWPRHGAVGEEQLGRVCFHCGAARGGVGGLSRRHHMEGDRVQVSVTNPHSSVCGLFFSVRAVCLQCAS